MHFVDHYVVDWEKVRTVEDVKLILKAMNVTFEVTHQGLDAIEHLIRREKKPSGGMVYD